MITTLQAASFETPDTGQGGNAVTGASVTGHSSTTASAVDVASELKTCRWFSFPSGPGSRLSATLKVTHLSDGQVTGPTALNGFTLSYSLNNGGSWTNIVARSNYSGSQGPTVFSLALSAGQDLTQVQVRDSLAASSNQFGDSASASATISAIGIEVLTKDALLVMM